MTWRTIAKLATLATMSIFLLGTNIFGQNKAKTPVHPPIQHWVYEHYEDEMGRGTVKTAKTKSTNTIEFSYPYQYPQRTTLVLRAHPEEGNTVYVLIERGQFLCSMEGCTVAVRFDDDDIQTFSALPAADMSSNVIFINEYATFLEHIRQAKRVAIEAAFFQEGKRVMIFNTAGLHWES